MKPRLLSVQPPSWPATVQILRDLQDHGWIFRGQYSASWGLETSLERYHRLHNIRNPRCSTPDLRQFERERINKYLEPYESPLMVRRPRSLWAAVMNMQHYRWPTRLLDFTSCSKRAIFFALTDEPKESWALWCINRHYIKTISMQKTRALLAKSKDVVSSEKAALRRWLLGAMDHELSESDDLYRGLVKSIMETGITSVSIYAKVEESIAFVVQPHEILHGNERIYKQRGLFLAPFNLGHHPSNIYSDAKKRPLITRFEKNLLDAFGFDSDGLAEYVAMNRDALARPCASGLPIDEYGIIKLVLSPAFYAEARAYLLADPADIVDAERLGFGSEEVTMPSPAWVS